MENQNNIRNFLTTFNPVSSFFSMEAFSKSSDSSAFYKGVNGSRKKDDKRSHAIIPLKESNGNTGSGYFNKNLIALNKAIKAYELEHDVIIIKDNKSFESQLTAQIDDTKYEHVKGQVYRDLRSGTELFRYYIENNQNSKTIKFFDSDLTTQLDEETQVAPYKKPYKESKTVKTFDLLDTQGNTHSIQVEFPCQFRQVEIESINKLCVNGKIITK
jgi:hypothetical protein